MLTITACGKSTESANPEDDELEGTSYSGVNHTETNIISIIVNGQGGIAHVAAQWVGGQDCCVFLPSKWHPGIKVTIKWELGGTYLLDSKGKRVMEDGVPVVLDGGWKTKTVEVPEYKGEDARGYLYIFFYPNDEVKVLRSYGYPKHPNYSLPKKYTDR